MAPCQELCTPDSAGAPALSAGAAGRRQRLHACLGQLKRCVRARQQCKKSLSTLQALDSAIQMLNDDPPQTESILQQESPISENPNPEEELVQRVLPPPPAMSPPQAVEGALNGGSGDGPALLGRRFLGTLFVSLPDGLILECREASDDDKNPNFLGSAGVKNLNFAISTIPEKLNIHDSNNRNKDPNLSALNAPVSNPTSAETLNFSGSNDDKILNFIGPGSPDSGSVDDQKIPNLRGTGPLLSAICRPGSSLLALLHGKGAQTLLLNAFCGHARRRMYARLKWGESATALRACELLCEFSKDPHSVSRRLASIQLFCVQSAGTDPAAQRLTFTTRHNASGALIYLDSASIPLLGHFPSECTGKSLFDTIVHAGDVPRVQEAHARLQAAGDWAQIVRTPGLRLRSYAGAPVRVDSEWAAFINPWTRHIEMVVGRHTHVADAPPAPELAQQQLAKPVPTQLPKVKQEPQEKQRQNGKSAEVKSEEAQQEEQVHLSYNQINCLENVHRLLKSQSSTSSTSSSSSASAPSSSAASCTSSDPARAAAGAPLTRAVLQQHDARWEEQCRDRWRRRLSVQQTVAEGGEQCQQQLQLQKRPMSQEQPGIFGGTPGAAPPPTKLVRFGSEANAWAATANANNNNINFVQPPAGSLQQQLVEPAELLALLGLQQQRAPLALPHHPQLLAELLQAAATARNTLATRLLLNG